MSGFAEPQTFTTKDVEPWHSVDAWCRYVREVYFNVDLRSNNETIDGLLKKRSFAEVASSAWRSGAQRATRSRHLALTDKVETFCICVMKQGVVEYRQRGREHKAGPGEVYILNAAEAFETDLSDPTELVCLTVPCDLLRGRVRGIDDMCGRRQFVDPALASTLCHLITNALDVAPSVDADRLQDLCFNMIDMMILEDRPGWRYSELVATCLAEKARRVIRERLSNPDFTVAEAAAACGTSTRQLQHAFKTEGSTFGRELLETRLLASARMLKSREMVPRQIGDVAAECGFSSQSHFATRYRERFGHSPREERRRL